MGMDEIVDETRSESGIIYGRRRWVGGELKGREGRVGLTGKVVRFAVGPVQKVRVHVKRRRD